MDRAILKKWYTRLCMMVTIALMGHVDIHGAESVLSLQDAIRMARSHHRGICMAERGYQAAVLAHKIKNLHQWLPQSMLGFVQGNRWKMGSSRSATFAADPIFSLSWSCKKIPDQIVGMKVNKKSMIVADLRAKKSIEQAIKEVVDCYYALALAQKESQKSIQLMRGIQVDLQKQKTKLALDWGTKIDLLDMELALEQAKLDRAQAAQAVKKHCMVLNSLLGKPIDQKTVVATQVSLQPIWEMIPSLERSSIDLDVSLQEQQVEMAKAKLRGVQWGILGCLGIASGLHMDRYSHDLLTGSKEYSRDKKIDVSFSCTLDVFQLLLLPGHIRQKKLELQLANMALYEQKCKSEVYWSDQKWRYTHAKDRYKVAQQHVSLYQKKQALCKERYRLGELEWSKWHQAQEDLQKSELALLQAGFELKKVELSLCHCKK